MKLLLVAAIILLLIMVGGGASVISQVGEVEAISVLKGDIKNSYYEIKDRTIIAIEPIYRTDITEKEECEYHEKNDTTTCINYQETQKVQIGTIPIYEESKIQEITTDKKTYEFDTKGCWVCGKWIACVSKQDGYSESRSEKYKCDKNNKPIIRDGESGFVEIIQSLERTQERSDVGEI